MLGHGSPSHRLLVIEESVPYDDVLGHWCEARDEWAHNVWMNRARVRDLGGLMVEFLDALTSKAIATFHSNAGKKRCLHLERV